MSKMRAKIVSTAPYAEGSEAVRAMIAPVQVEGSRVNFGEPTPVAFLPMPWNLPGECPAYAKSLVGEVGVVVFAEDAPIGLTPPGFDRDLPVVEFFLPGR